MCSGSLLSAKDAPELMETLSQTMDKLATVKEARAAFPAPVPGLRPPAREQLQSLQTKASLLLSFLGQIRLKPVCARKCSGVREESYLSTKTSKPFCIL